MKIFGKSDKWTVIMTIAGVMLLTGCGKSAHEGESTSSESKEDKAMVAQPAASPAQSESADSESDGEDDTVYEELLATTSDWKKTPITVSPKGSKANIEVRLPDGSPRKKPDLSFDKSGFFNIC